MIIHINSYPGVGKLTIAKQLAAMLDAKLLDNHSVYNVAFALTEYKSKVYYDTIRSVRAIAYERIHELPSDIPVILTNAHARDSEWGNECWDNAIHLAKQTNRPHIVILLDCSREENARRIQGVDREAFRKPRDPALFRQGTEDRALIDRGADALLRLDVTDLTAQAAAMRMAEWLKTHQ
ncbi:MAG: hypothetical protein AAFP97_07685 [Pseudomonadota bacterium]